MYKPKLQYIFCPMRDRSLWMQLSLIKYLNSFGQKPYLVFPRPEDLMHDRIIDRTLKNILGTKKRGGKNDLDFDGVPNRKDCQPRNTMRQDTNVPIKAKSPPIILIKDVNVKGTIYKKGTRGKALMIDAIGLQYIQLDNGAKIVVPPTHIKYIFKQEE